MADAESERIRREHKGLDGLDTRDGTRYSVTEHKHSADDATTGGLCPDCGEIVTADESGGAGYSGPDTYVGRLTPAGFAVGHVHLAREAADRWATVCGLMIGQYGVTHYAAADLSCTACKRIGRRIGNTASE